MKKIILIFSTILLFSCQQTQKGALEGSWKRKGTIIYKEGKPFDTVPYEGVHFKIYDKNSFLILVNPIKIDSITGEDTDKGIAMGGEKYFIRNGHTFERLKYGTGWVSNYIKNNKTDSTDYVEFKLKLDYGKNHFSQAYPIDSLGNSTAYYFERIKN
jgi:hypothetical protein